MFDIHFHINVFVSLIQPEHSLKTSNKRSHIALPTYFFEVEHPLKHQIKEHTCKFKVDKIIYSKS